jgi:large subunit ribosomal protein L4e
MKAQLFDVNGNKKSDVELPEIFNSAVREDMVIKFFEVEKEYQPYATWEEAGKRHVASGKVSHRRHKWQTAYGKGISRVPRKRMWRRGTQFYWVGAEVSSTRGGRRAHPPKGIYSPRKINKQEAKMAMNSAFAATANPNLIVKRYATLGELKAAPWVIESLPQKTKDVLESLRKIFGGFFSLILKRKVVRAGKGKTRGRKYKSNAGLLLVVGKDENVKIKGIDVRKMGEVKISDLYPLGRITLYTTKALEELKQGGKK